MQDDKRENSIIKKNILRYLEYKGISKYECYNKTKISRTVLSQPNGMTEDNLLKFLAYYNDVNISWLITGQGEMLTTASQDLNRSSESVVINEDYKEKYYSCIEKLNNHLEELNKLQKQNQELKEQLNEFKENESILASKKGVKSA